MRNNLNVIGLSCLTTVEIREKMFSFEMGSTVKNVLMSRISVDLSDLPENNSSQCILVDIRLFH